MVHSDVIDTGLPGQQWLGRLRRRAPLISFAARVNNVTPLGPLKKLGRVGAQLFLEG